MSVLSFGPISATTAPFALAGGQYIVDYLAASWGTVTLQKLAGDGTTWINALAAFSADGIVGATTGQYLPPGQYRLLVAGATGVYVSISPIFTL